MQPLLHTLLAVGLALLGGIPAGSAAADPAQFRLTSPAFTNGDEIPARFTCDGANASPPLSWSDPPPGTQSLALIVVDVDAPDPRAPVKPWVHWIVYAMDPGLRSLEDGASRKLPAGARHGRNDWRTADYGGPCPSVGRHRYVHRLIALDLPPSNLGSPSQAALFSRIAPNVIGRAELEGTYERKPRSETTP
jgi:Raf kinase inhibitor-like YbhB/YbcL family protein